MRHKRRVWFCETRCSNNTAGGSLCREIQTPPSRYTFKGRGTAGLVTRLHGHRQGETHSFYFANVTQFDTELLYVVLVENGPYCFRCVKLQPSIIIIIVITTHQEIG